MKLLVIEPARLETSDGIVKLASGQIIMVEHEKAAYLVQTGKFRLRNPYLDKNNTLRIPFDSDTKYHWWAGGQSIDDTLAELGVALEVWERYTNQPYPEEIN